MEMEEALRILGFDEIPNDMKEVRRSFRKLALKCHPDKNPDVSPSVFGDLTRALEIVELSSKEDSKIDDVEDDSDVVRSRRDSFDPRAFEGGCVLGDLRPGIKSVVWRCTKCPKESSICCRVKPRKHRCICGHKLSSHTAENNFACKDCPCKGFRFNVQLNGWQSRCGCKHKHTDHDPVTGKCMKLVGKYKKPCDCKGYHVTWNCNCGHSWKDHVTTFVFKEYSSMARDWVCSGVSEAVREEAEWKRRRAAKKIASKVSSVEKRLRTAEFIAKTVRSMGLSVAAEEYVTSEITARQSGLIERSSTSDDDDGEERERVRKNLELIYKAYAPAKAENIPRLLEKFKDKDPKVLLRRVMKKYNVSSMSTVEASLRRKAKKRF